jgi:CBS domain containing-hemolysin-like protein
MSAWIDIAVLGIAAAVTFLLSGMEAGVLAISRFRIRRLARQGHRRAASLQRLLDHPENFLWTILVGHTLATFAIVSLAMRRIDGAWGTRPAWFIGAIVSVLLVLYVFADLLPKVLFRRFPNRLSLMGVVPFRALHVLLSPAVAATEWASRHLLRMTGGQSYTGRLFGSRAEFRQVIEESAQSLSREEVSMINRILDLQNLRVRDVMTPIERAATLQDSQTVRDLLELARTKRVTYVPLWKDSGKHRRVHGVVTLSDALYDVPPGTNPSLATLVRPAVFVDEGMRLEDALKVMQRSRQRLAIVLNAPRRETGVITLNDIVRAMFGEVGV